MIPPKLSSALLLGALCVLVAGAIVQYSTRQAPAGPAGATQSGTPEPAPPGHHRGAPADAVARTGVASAPNAADEGAAAQPVATARTVRFRVLDAASGVPLPGATVQLFDHEPPRALTTDARGEVESAFGGKAVVEVTAKDHVTLHRFFRDPVSEPELLLRLHAGTRLRVRSTTVRGDAVAHQVVRFELVQAEGVAAPYPFLTYFDCTTNGDGRADVGPVVPGRWRIETDPLGPWPGTSKTVSVQLGAPMEIAIVNEPLAPEHFVSGEIAPDVLSAAESAVLSVEVEGFPDVPIDDSGRFFVRNGPDHGSFRIRLRTRRGDLPRRLGAWRYVSRGDHGVVLSW